MHREYVAIGAVEPGDEDDLVTGRYLGECRPDRLVEDHPCVGRTLVALAWRVGSRDQRGLDAADDPESEVSHRAG